MINLSNGHAQLKQAQVYRENKDYNSAIKELKEALHLGLDIPRLHLELGGIYREKRYFDLAIKEFKKAIDQNSNNYEAYLGLGRTYREKGVVFTNKRKNMDSPLKN